MLEQAIAQIEEKINLVNEKISTALNPANNKQKTIQERRQELEGDHPRILELNTQIQAVHKKQAKRKLKLDKLRRKLAEIEQKDGRDMIVLKDQVAAIDS